MSPYEGTTDVNVHQSETPGPSSTVITNPNEWYETSLLIPHEAIRDGLNRMEDVCANWGEDRDWKLPSFLKWYKRYFYYFVHHHHAHEEEIFFPWIMTRAKEAPKKASEDHVALLKAMNAILEVKTANELKKLIPHFVQDMKKHLAEEEEWWPNVLKNHFSEEEEHAQVEITLQALGLYGAKIGLPWIVTEMSNWAPHGFKEKFFGSLPPPLRLMYKWSWVVDYEKNNLGLLQSIKNDKELRTWFWV